jgi:hypothetical protein
MCSRGRCNVTNLKRSLVSSEGALGMILEIPLRLAGIPEVISAGTLLLRRRALGRKAVVQIMLSGPSSSALVAGDIGGSSQAPI